MDNSISNSEKRWQTPTLQTSQPLTSNFQSGLFEQILSLPTTSSTASDLGDSTSIADYSVSSSTTAARTQSDSNDDSTSRIDDDKDPADQEDESSSVVPLANATQIQAPLETRPASEATSDETPAGPVEESATAENTSASNSDNKATLNEAEQQTVDTSADAQAFESDANSDDSNATDLNADEVSPAHEVVVNSEAAELSQETSGKEPSAAKTDAVQGSRERRNVETEDADLAAPSDSIAETDEFQSPPHLAPVAVDPAREGKTGNETVQSNGAVDAKAKADIQVDKTDKRGKWYQKRDDQLAEATASQHPTAAEAEQQVNAQDRSEQPSETADASTTTTILNQAEFDPTLQTSSTIHNIVPETMSEPSLGSSVVAQVAGNVEVGSLDGTDGSTALPPRSPTAINRESAANRAESPTQPDVLSQQEKVRLIQRVSRSFGRIGPEGGQINLKLHPPQLGSLNVQVRLEGRSMTAKLTTETSAARDVILESLPVLRGRLAEQGFDISQFQVDVADNNPNAAFSGNSGQDSLNGQQRDPQSSRVDYRRSMFQERGTSGDTNPTARAPLSWTTSTGIDVHA